MISDQESNMKALELHPELEDWEEEDFDRAEFEQGVNWRLHLHLDAAVLRRASEPSLPDAGVIEELQRQGDSRLDAIHRVANVLATHIWKIMWVAQVEHGEVPPERIPPEIRGAKQPTNEELNTRIRALASAKPHARHRRRRR